MDKKFDAFISHASEDKQDFVDPLVAALRSFGLKIWYDSHEMSVGNLVGTSLSGGISRSRYGVVVLSKNFLKKSWTESEVEGLLAVESKSRRVVLPVLHGITVEALKKRFPLLAGRVATTTRGKMPFEVAAELARVIRPDIYARLAAAFSPPPPAARPARRGPAAEAEGGAEQLTKQLFDVLYNLQGQPNGDRPEGLRHKTVVAGQEAKGTVIREMIAAARSEIRLICYSMTYWKDPFEEDFLRFLGRDTETSLRVLMLKPDSPGFMEKSALEAFSYMNRHSSSGWRQEWRKSVDKTRADHAADIRSSAETLGRWRTTYGKRKVNFNWYSDTPILYGFCFDRTSLLVSSYFVNPTRRGYYLPFFRVQDTTSGPALFLRNVYLNWFDVKCAGAQSAHPPAG